MTGQKQLIVIHDNPSRISGMLQHLNSRDYSIAYASSGAEGMKLAKTAKPDMILLNADLPDTNGLEICARLKSDPLIQQCVVILMDSNATLSGEPSKWLEAGADSHIAGPVTSLELAERIQALFRMKSTEDALKACEKRFRLMYEKSPLPYMTLNENGRIQDVNPACERLLGHMKADALGASIYEMLMPSDADKLRAYFSSMGSLEQIQDLKLSIRQKNGSVAQVLFNGFQQTDTRYSDQETFCSLYDVSEKMKNQADILKAQQLEFTATLAGGIAHDFNNLLMAIMGNISLAQLFLSPEDKANKILEKAEFTCNQANELTQQFIILSKCGYPSKKPSSILKLLKESAVIGIPSPKVDVVLDLSDDIWRIEVDEHQMRYALTHLMTNAVEAMPDGGKIHVTVRNIVVSSDPPHPAHPIASGPLPAPDDPGPGTRESLPSIFPGYLIPTTPPRNWGLKKAWAWD